MKQTQPNGFCFELFPLRFQRQAGYPLQTKLEFRLITVKVLKVRTHSSKSNNSKILRWGDAAIPTFQIFLFSVSVWHVYHVSCKVTSKAWQIFHEYPTILIIIYKIIIIIFLQVRGVNLKSWNRVIIRAVPIYDSLRFFREKKWAIP